MRISQFRSLLDATRLTDAAVRRVLQKQVQRIQDRVNEGVDIHGDPYTPYKYPKYGRQSRPLLRAARLFSPAQLTVSSTATGKVGAISITGRAARIARWQNRLREMYGYNETDRGAAASDIRQEIADQVRRRRRGSSL